jgi:hypothetical protein
MSGHPGLAVPPSLSRDDHASSTAGNSCFQVTLGYRRLERDR